MSKSGRFDRLVLKILGGNTSELNQDPNNTSTSARSGRVDSDGTYEDYEEQARERERVSEENALRREAARAEHRAQLEEKSAIHEALLNDWKKQRAMELAAEFRRQNPEVTSFDLDGASFSFSTMPEKIPSFYCENCGLELKKSEVGDHNC